MDPFPLNGLPMVPLREVFDKMNAVDIFEMARSSNNMYHAVAEFGVIAEIALFTPRTLTLKFVNGTRLIWDFTPRPGSDKEVTIGRVVYRQWTKVSPDTIHCLPNNFDSDIRAAYDYLLDLYRIRKFHVEIINCTHSFIHTFLDYMPRNCDFLRFSDPNVTEEQSNDILFHFLKIVEIEIVEGNIWPNPRIDTADYVYLGNAREFSRHDLMKLSARRLEFFAPSTPIINLMLQFWKSGDCWHDMYSLRILVPFRPTFNDLLLKGLDARDWYSNGTRTGKMFNRSDDGTLATITLKSHAIEVRFLLAANRNRINY